MKSLLRYADHSFRTSDGDCIQKGSRLIFDVSKRKATVLNVTSEIIEYIFDKNEQGYSDTFHKLSLNDFVNAVVCRGVHMVK